MQKRIERLQDAQTFVSKGSGLDLQLASETLRAGSMLVLENLQVFTPDRQRQLVEGRFLHIRPGDRVALLGKNGVGKSTTLNLVLDAFETPHNAIRFNPNVQLGFYDQELRQFAQPVGRFDWLRSRVDGHNERITQVLLQAGVAYVDFTQPVNALSGGERARMMFMLFRLRQPNFLILDEPTNHIDLEGREQLEQQLITSGATLLITGHDRRFIERVANRWWWINNGVLEDSTIRRDSMTQFLPGRLLLQWQRQAASVRPRRVCRRDMVRRHNPPTTPCSNALMRWKRC